MESFITPIGAIHLVVATMAMIFGALVIVKKKGTKSHIRMGYWYVGCMTVLIITAFMIYRLFGGWGIFHHLTVVSLITLLLGMLPILFKKPSKNWRYMHFSFMFWSVIGLYAAFTAEALTRIPETPFLGMVGVSTTLVMVVGGVIFGKNKQKWASSFGK